MLIVCDVRIERSIDDVFAYVSDPRNDPAWCRKVQSVEQVEGSGPGLGARYAVVHRPIPVRPPRRMDYACTGWLPPRSIEWREDDGTDVFLVTYELEVVGSSTLFTQRDDARVGAPRLVHPILRRGIRHDIARQLRALKEVLEGRDGLPASAGAPKL